MKAFLIRNFYSIRTRIIGLFIAVMAILLALMMWFTRSRENSLNAGTFAKRDAEFKIRPVSLF